MPRSPGLPRRATALLAAGALLTGGGLAAAGPLGANASSHREAPNTLALPQYDNTDVYAFVSPDTPGKVTLIGNWNPLEEPAGGPNFYPFADDARYVFKIDNDGDARADVKYGYVFHDQFRTKNTFLYNTGVVTSLDDPDLNFRQTYVLSRKMPDKPWRVIRHGEVAPSYVGEGSMPNYAALSNSAIESFGPAGHRSLSFAGQADDSFFLDLRLFDLLYGGDLSEVGDDTLAGFNVNTLALQVPKRDLTAGAPKDNPVIGVWSATTKEAANGFYRQVSRLGNPLVNEVVIPLKDKVKFNRSSPRGDARFLEYVTDPEVPELIEAIYGIPAPATPRDDLVAVFLTGIKGLNQPANVRPSEQLRLNVMIPPSDNPHRLGVIGGDNAGFPNGRRLTDDVLDIELQVLEGELVGNKNDLGDAVNVNDKPFRNRFPYVALPTSGSVEQPHHASGYTALTGGAAPDASTSTGAPAALTVPVSLVGFGLLLLAAGGVLARRPRLTTA